MIKADFWHQRGLVITVEGPQGGWSTTVQKPYARISAQKGAEIVLSDLKIGSRGLYFHHTAAGIYVLGFSQAAVAEEPWQGWLDPGQTIPFGPYKIAAHSDGPQELLPLASRGPAPDAKGSSLEPYPVIAIAFSDREMARRKLSRQLTTIGRLRPSVIPVQSNDLSASHVVFYWNGNTLWAIDLLSRMGVLQNGSLIECAQVPLGGSLVIGEVKLTYAGLFSHQDSAEALSGMELHPPVVVNALQVEGGDAGLALASEDLQSQRAMLEQWRAELVERERALAQEQERWLTQQRQRESEWRQRVAEMAERQANVNTEQQRIQLALAEERRSLRAQIREHNASLAKMRSELEQQCREFQSQREQWLTQQRQREEEFERRAEEIGRREAAVAGHEQILPRKSPA